jgi:CheY-like chemotaxis protein
MSLKILLVEDNAGIQEIYRRFLEDEGFEVIPVADGLEAKDKVLSGNWDLLLLDIMLPKLDGLSVLKEFYVNPSLNKKPVFVISNVNEPEFIKQCLNLGVKEYIIKAEVLPNEIIDKVKKGLETVINAS